VGQFHNLISGPNPATAAHIGQPYVTSDYLGFRSPGVTLLHKVPLGDMSVELGVQANRNNWTDTLPACSATVTTGCLPSGVPFGEASGLPNFQARVSLTGGKTASPWPQYPAGDFNVFVAGEWDQKDINGYGVAGGNVFTTYAVQAGAKVLAGPLLVAANAFVGQNTGGLIGTIGSQFAPLTGNNVFDMGGWIQAGVMLTKEWALWGTAGSARPNLDDVDAAKFTRRFQNVYAGMLSYKDGPYIVGIEWVHWLLGTSTLVKVNQGIATVLYSF
jgi:hypothetical protein